MGSFVRVALVVVPLLHSASGGGCDEGGGSCVGAPTRSLRLLQERTGAIKGVEGDEAYLVQSKMVVGRTRTAADDASFLMRATFGPTRATLQELSQTSWPQWIADQMALPVESHREYYRQRANPRYETHMAQFTSKGGGLTYRSPCAKGSRWMAVEQSVVNEYSDGQSMPFVTSSFSPDVLFLSADQGGDCILSQHNFTFVGGVYYEHELRVELFDNTPGNAKVLHAEECEQRVDPRLCSLSHPGEKCTFVCGSDGEVANEPTLGHLLSYETRRKSEHEPDYEYDGDHRFENKAGKRVVWFMKAIEGHDQLRQRVAWALAQIIVFSSDGVKDIWSEKWLAAYDIFVRNAFGNYRDILGNITYTPLMSSYLTYRKSWSFDSEGNYPDENYAREIMQLFTIGLEKLNPDGTPELDSEGNTVPTYDTDRIMDYSRLFTGFFEPGTRVNTEGDSHAGRVVALQKHKHDIYPKPDLHGGFLGDNYPLCVDLPPRSFLSAGAKYEFRAYSSRDNMGYDIFPVSQESQLFAELCNEQYGECKFHLTRELASSLDCTDKECTTETLRTVKVQLPGTQAGYYEYVAPTCVHHFFYNGHAVYQGNKIGDPKKMACVGPDMPVAGASCCSPPSSNTCTNKEPSHGCSDPAYLKKKCAKWDTKGKNYCRLACWDIGKGYDGDDCSGGLYREQRVCGYPNELGVSKAKAIERCEAAGLQLCEKRTADNDYCKFDRAGAFVWTEEACPTTLQVHWDGKVSGNTKNHEPNRFSVNWTNGVPSPGTYDLRVEVESVFDDVPTKPELLAEAPALIGAYPPPPCSTSVCGSDDHVCYCGDSGTFGSGTVLEYEGRFYKNERSLVNVGGHKFRNPPVFRLLEVQNEKNEPTDWGRNGQRLVYAEVDSHLDQLFYHQNTAPFVCKLLIQRLVKSNPTPAYVSSCTTAFSTGAYGDEVLSGRYGDLGAAVTAILLDPEASAQGGTHDGALREPLLKLVHMMRAMEYKSFDEEMIAMTGLRTAIGQAPYRSPSVFNFYDPDFTPDRFDEGMYAPEFQIFDAPTSLGFLNGMISFIENGLMNEKEKRNVIERPGFGYSYSGAQGNFSLELDPGLDVDAQLAELDLLLTGERLSTASMQVVRTAFDSAAEGEELKAALKAIVMAPEFNTYGDAMLDGATQRTWASFTGQSRDYKALVLLFFGGGADSWNFVVPLECGLYDEYLEARTLAAYGSPSDFHRVQTSNQACTHFGIHGSLPTVASLYNDGKAAFVSNIGSLVEPLTRDTYFSGGRLCNGLFSHKHQQSAAQSSVCQTSGGSPRGVGGRIADALSAGDMGWSAQSFSTYGNNIFSKGFDTNFQVVDPDIGNVRFFYLDSHEEVLANITSQKFGNAYCEEYAQSILEQVHAAEDLGNFLDAAELQTDYKTDSKLAKQLQQVAQLIATRDERKAERDFYFVRTNGWDMHKGLKEDLPEKLGEVDSAIKGFVEELTQQGVFDAVTLVSHSDFGRTLTSNGDGVDHAWAGQQFVISGSLNGGQVFNDYPATLRQHNIEHPNDQDIGRGRLIPKYPWESVMVPIAKWMGVDDAQLTAVFPNYNNFNESHFITDLYAQ